MEFDANTVQQQVAIDLESEFFEIVDKYQYRLEEALSDQASRSDVLLWMRRAPLHMGIIVQIPADITKECTVTKCAAKEFINHVKFNRTMYRYWVAKRTRNQKPLLRRFWPITQPADPDPHMVFRPRDEQGMKNRLRRSRKDDKSSYEKLKLLQQDLEQVTTILNSLRKREILKASKVKYE